MYVCVPHACLVPTEARRKHRVPLTGITDGCEPLCGCWELNPGLLEEEAVLYSIAFVCVSVLHQHMLFCYYGSSVI